MLKAILNNPYRILGVYANSPKKEQIANKGKMQAFLRVGRSMDFPLDLKGILPLVNRTQEVVDLAESELALPTDQVKHAQFWFVNVTPIDHIAFNHLFQGNLDEAMSIWQKQVNASSLQNLFVCHLIRENYLDAINLCATPLYNDYTLDFLKAIDENASVRAEDLIESVIEVMSQEKVITTHLISDVEDKNWSARLEAIEIKPIIEELERDIEEAKRKRKENSLSGLTAGNVLMTQATGLLIRLIKVFPNDDPRYSRIADKISLEVLQCGIDYYNDSDDEEAALKVLPLFEFARFYAIGSQATQRCNENYFIVKRAADSLPPKEVREEIKKIEQIIEKYQKKDSKSQENKNETTPITELLEYFSPFKENFETAKNAIKMLKEASKPLVAIKEKLGKTHRAYLEVSTELASTALNFIIEDVNRAINDESFIIVNYLHVKSEEEMKRQRAYMLKEVFAKAWEATQLIGYLDINQEFRTNRYIPSKKKLYKIINDAKGFDLPDGYYIIKGCACLIRAENIFLTDDELFFSCKERRDYEIYLQKYPNGKHRQNAKFKVEKFLFDDCENKSDYEYYLKRYPIGNYAEKAKKKIEELEIIRAKQKRKRFIIIILLVIILMAISAIWIIIYMKENPLYDMTTGEEIPLLERLI